jgi:hypothetical protein
MITSGICALSAAAASTGARIESRMFASFTAINAP